MVAVAAAAVAVEEAKGSHPPTAALGSPITHLSSSNKQSPRTHRQPLLPPQASHRSQQPLRQSPVSPSVLPPAPLCALLCPTFPSSQGRVSHKLKLMAVCKLAC